MIRLFTILSVFFFLNGTAQNDFNILKSSESVQFTDVQLAEVDIDAFPDYIRVQAHAFYDSLHYQTFWLGKDKALSRAQALLESMENLGDYGLYPSTYGYPYLSRAVPSLYSADPSKKEIIELDLFMTAAYMTMVSHLLDGRITHPGTANRLWVRKTENHREMNCIMALKNGRDFAEVISSMHPKHPFYEPLLRKFQEIRKSEKVKYHDFSFEEPTEVAVGFSDPKIKKLRENLQRRGFEIRTDTNIVDSTLVGAIKDFQESRGIKVDGIPGENTLRYLNMSYKDLERLIALNLERMRWFPDGLKEEFLLVNIPEFMLRYYENGDKQIDMKVVAGEIVNSTPVFSDTLTYIVFNPDWTVPQSIIHEEMIPKMVDNPSHYTNLNFSVYENGEEIDPDTVDWASEEINQRYFGMVQNPGASNSLGLVKFMLPNSLSIYLHDTPADYLFERSERDFSHGCIRLEKPFELARIILDDRPMWTKERIDQILESGETEQVHLNDPIPVMISYITTWVDDEGNLRILEDIYGHDKRQLEKIVQL